VGKKDIFISTSPYFYSMKKFVATLRRSMLLQVLVLVQLTPGLVFLPVQLSANPEGGVVVAGNVSFSGLNTPVLDINNASQHAIIDWQTFSIAAGEVTNINQAANAHTLNRVISSSPTEIYGMLKAANGGVTVINSNGIMVGESGVVDIAGLMTMSTLDISNNDFLNGGSNNFKGDSSAGIRNYGSISSQSGDVVLLGNFLQNAGSVSAPDGTVAFGAGGDMIVDQGGGGVISVRGGGPGGETGIENTGSVNAAGVELKAHGNVYALAIKNDGLVRASGYNFKGGRLTLSGGSNGNIVNNGQLQARNRDGSGGQVEIAGGRVQLAAGSSTDGSGELGRNGGSVNVSGDDVIIGQGASVSAAGASAGSVSLTGANSASVSGSVDASGDMGRGGKVDVTAEAVIIGSTASINASGLTGGGKVRIGGGFHGTSPDIANSQQTTVEQGALIIADGEEGGGGEVVVWSDGGTLFEGEVSAQALGSFGNGGFIEVSGRESLQIGGSVSTASANGRDGTFLIDPVNVTISAIGGGGTMTDAFLRSAVESSNVIIHTNGGNPGDTGSISIFSGAKVIYSSPNSLTFLSDGNIFVDGDIKNIGTVDTLLRSASLNDTSGTGNITLVAGWDGSLPADLTGNVSSADFLNPDGTPNFTGEFGSWGAAGSTIYLNEGGLESVEVGSARGETNVFADTIQMRLGRSDGKFTQIGYRRVGDIRDVWDGNNNNNEGFGGYFADPNSQIVDGDINVSALSNVFMLPSDQSDTVDFNKVRNHSYNQIGHGGMRRADDAIDNTNTATLTGFGYDRGYIGVDDGNNSGDINVFAGNSLIMVGGRVNTPTQIGHGGQGGGAPNNGNVRTGLAQYIAGNMSGDITVKAGTIDMEAGLYSDAPVQIGHGGLNISGDLDGDIYVESTLGGISGTAAPVLGHNNNDNARDRSYVQIGHGGVFTISTPHHLKVLPARIAAQGDAAVNLLTQSGVVAAFNTSAPGDGVRIDPATGLPYGYSGDIDVISAAGIHMTASGNMAHAMIGHGANVSSNTFGAGGDIRGDIFVQAKAGDVIFDRIAIQLDVLGRDRRNVGAGAYVQIGHGGRRYSGGHTGDIVVDASGNIEFYAGRSEAYAQIGHGGRGNDGTTTNVNAHRGLDRISGTNSGDITVTAGGGIKFRSGFGSGNLAYSMIGHGGYLHHADIYYDPNESTTLNGPHVGGGASSILTDSEGNPILDGDGKYQLVGDRTQQGHNGDIYVRAEGDISFVAGQTEALPGQEPFGIEMNRGDNFTMIGNGGRSTYGDHWGEITVISNSGDITFEATAGWDGVSYENSNEGAYNMAANTADRRGAPRLGQDNEDNATNGVRNFAMIGNGGWDGDHRIQSVFVETDATGAVALSKMFEVTALAADDIFRTGTAHGLAVNDRITFQSLQRTDGGVAVINTVYYVQSVLSPTSFTIATTASAAAALNVTQNLVNNSRDHSGAMGAGIGVWGNSDISVIARNGDVNFKAAQLDSVGTGLQSRAILNRAADNSYYYTDVYGNPIALSATVGQHNWAPDVVNRITPNIDPGGITLGRTNLEVTGVLNSTNAAPNRFVMANGHGFAGGTSATLTINGVANTANVIQGGEIVYAKGTGVATYGLVEGQAYQVVNARINERDFQLRPVDANGIVGAVIVIPVTAGGELFLDQTWNGWVAPPAVAAATDGFAMIGNGGRSTDYQGGYGVGGESGLRGAGDGKGHRGDITVEAGGTVSMLAGNLDPAVSTRQWMTIERVAYNGTPLLNAGGTALPDILVGPGAAGAATTTGYVGGNFTNASSQGQINPTLRVGNFVMIGSGGYSSLGDHNSDINITAGINSVTGGLILSAGEGREDFAQIGAGGFNGDGFDPLGFRDSDNNHLDNEGNSGDIDIQVAGDVKVLGGGQNNKVVGITGTTTDTATTAVANNLLVLGGLAAHDEDRYSYAQIGNGGAPVGGTHSGDISIISSNGGLDVIAGKNTQIAYAQVGNGGYASRGQEHNGDIYIRVAGDINLIAGRPFIDDGTSDIAGVTSTAGQIAHGRMNYAQIGHGGYETDPQAGNLDLRPGVGGFFGDISVITTGGSLLVQGGGTPTLTRNDDTYFRSLYAQIGHGGNWTDGDHRGDILISASQNVTINGGAAGREGYGQVGHGGVQPDVAGVNNGGNLSGDIQVIAGNNLTVNRGANMDSSVLGTTNRAGTELYNNYAKIGHGNDAFRQRIASLGNRDGDIHISVGQTINLADTLNRPFANEAYSIAFGETFPDRILIGHMNSRIGLQDPFRSTDGDTFIAVGRDFPYVGGTGRFITNAGTVITSSREGVSSEVRLYMPEASNNQIATGTFINNANYTRSPAPGSGRADEQIATEHLFTTGANGELEASFTPEGDYPFQSFGLYNVYYAEAAPIPPLPGAPNTDFLDFDAYDRDNGFFGYDGYEEMLFNMALEDAMEDDSDPSTGVMTFEEWLDGRLGSRQEGRNGTSGSVVEEEEDEELRRRKRFAKRQVGRGALTYYVFDPGTNRLSSYRVFGVPQTALSVTQ